MAPVHDAGRNDPVEVLEDPLEGFPSPGRCRRQRTTDIARCQLRCHRPRLDVAPIVGDPVHERVPVTTELFVVHRRGALAAASAGISGSAPCGESPAKKTDRPRFCEGGPSKATLRPPTSLP